MLFIKVKINLMSKEIHIDKNPITIIKWQRCKVGGKSFAISIDFQDGGQHLEINHRLADFTSRT